MRHALLLILALCALGARGAGADEVVLRAALHDGFARIAFDWPAPVAFAAKSSDHTLTLHFKRPIAAPVERLPHELGPYIASAALQDGGTTLVADLVRPVTVKAFTLHDKTVVVDLQPAPARAASPALAAPEPQEVQKAAPSKAAPKPPSDTVRIAAAKSDTVTRLTFQWPRRVGFALTTKGNTARLSFRAEGTIDAPALASMLPDYAPKVEIAKHRTAIDFAMPRGATFKAMRNGASILLAITAPKLKAQPAPQLAVTPPAPVPEATTAPPQPAAAPAQPATAPAPTAAIPTGPPPARVAVSLETSDTGASLHFDWPVATAAAVFRRGGSLWVAFSTPTTLDLSDLKARGASLFTSTEPVAIDGATVLRLIPHDRLEATVRRAGAAWIVDLKPQAAPLDAPIQPEAHPAASPASVTFDVHGAATPLRLADAEIGPLLVVPVAELGRGIDKPAEFVDFRVLPSTQGLVIEPYADDLSMKSGDDGVEVSRPAGLALSSDRDRLLSRNLGTAHRLFDFVAWRGPKGVDYVDERQRLDNAISAAQPAQRTAPRLALARFYFAHLFGAEAAAVLDAVAHDDPQGIKEAPVQALKGAACVLVGDLQCASDALGQHSLDGEPEAELWRASLASAQGDEETAAKNFLDSVSLLPIYPRTLRAQFVLEAAQAMLATGRVSLARPLLDLVLNDEATTPDRAMALYLDGKRLKLAGSLDDALARWDEAVKTGDPRASAEAKAARTLALLDAGKMTRGDAIKALDKVRYAWRGGHFEFGLLKKLGELQLADGDETDALDALHQAAVYFPNEPGAAAVGKEARDDFANLFLSDKGNDLPPLEALALYDGFHDLEPSGDRHDAIVKKLIDRLVAVDLLDRAAGLLDEQVGQRLHGLDKARGATQLALLRLMNHQPDLALAALDLPVENDLPSDLARQRQQLRARVMMELGKPADALNLIANDQSRDADRLRADIYWKGHDWKDAAETLSRLAGSPPADGKIEADEGRIVVGLAAALTLGDDQVGLARLRTEFGPAMAASPYASAFKVLAGSGAAISNGDPEAIAVQVAQLGALQDFMALYKAGPRPRS